MDNFDLKKYLAEGKLYENKVEKTLASLEKEKDNPERVKTLVKALTGLVYRGNYNELEVLTAVLNKIKEDNIKL
jgi:acyl carrier protein phosphodiesterase